MSTHRRRMMGGMLKEKHYIYLPNGAYINSGIKSKSPIKIEMKFSLTNPSVSTWLLGSRYGSPANDIGILNANNSGMGTASYIRFVCGKTATQYQDYNRCIFDTDTHHVILNAISGEYYFDGVKIFTFTPQSFNNNLNLPIGAFNNRGSVSDSGNKNIYFIKFWDENGLLGDFIPQEQNGVAGLYDSVSETFKTNAGSGTITYN